jgi:two-component sensor histidine kinase
MGLYELMTNAVKYGALSSPDGRILVTWDMVQNQETSLFQMEWREHGGPKVVLPPPATAALTILSSPI